MKANSRRWVITTLILVAVSVTAALGTSLLESNPTFAQSNTTEIEPNAGTWKTWVLTSGRQFRPPAPPDKTAEAAEIKQLKEMTAKRDSTALKQIAYWNTGSPAYRWNELFVDEAIKHGVTMGARDMALVDVAIYDATIAAWDGKYAYHRLRPSNLDTSLTTVIPNPQSPAYPSDYAAVATAASTVMVYLFPDDTDMLTAKVTEAENSRWLAGVEYPSDITAGNDLGKKVGDLVVARGKSDGSDAKWTGTVPTDKGKWTGTNPIFPTMGNWKPWVLTSGSEFRPSPPPAYDSAQETDELAQVENFKRTAQSNGLAFYYQYALSGTNNFQWMAQQTDKLIWAYHQDTNPPRAARTYALMSVTYDDSFIACFDAKYTYWAIRPFQLDPKFTTLFLTPNHPSYPSAHSCGTTGAMTILGYLFPTEASDLIALADEAGQSRIWAGIHFPADVAAGQTLGRQVAQKVITQANNDGSQ